MTPFPFAGDAPAGGVTFSHARESNQRARSSSQSPLTPFPPAAKTAFAPLLLLSPQSLKDGFAGAPCPLYTPFFLGIRGGEVIGSWGSGLASPPLVLPLVCGYWGVGGSHG